MKDTWTQEDIIAALKKVADDTVAQAERLRELDAAIGDGDLGITVTLGFEALKEALAELANADVGTILMRSGMAFNRKAASTFGALFATMMMRAARVGKGKEKVGLAEVREMFAVAVEGVKERGKADVGDKTLLDALMPAAEAVAAAAEEGAALPEALARAADAAEAGAKATVEMKSRAGRSSWFADRTAGIQDPGATAVAIMLRSVAEYARSSG
ncbi:MAG: dihydroxyacetone kinase subunit L [Chloroflexi bacterium]|nr:dihydroxyacetone kinase subunit L [Chloroflexota bacterium]